MPCLNEAETLETCIRKAQGALARLGIDGEVLIADNGSTDGSIEIARKLGARVVSIPERGYGSALGGGIAAARGRFVIMGDADDSYDWGGIEPFVARLRDGAQLVMGCRLPAGGGTIKPHAMPFSHRWLGNPVLSTLGRLLFGCPVTDFHCGMRGFDAAAIATLNLRTTGMEFASEMVIRATLGRLRIAQVPITLYPDGRSRPPHLRTWRDGWRHLRFMLLYSPNWLFWVPGHLLLWLGLIGFALVLPGPFHVGRIALDANTLLVSAICCIIGLQWIAFALAARLFASEEGLLPEDVFVKRLYGLFTLERGIILGLLFGLGGLALLGVALLYWARLDFGSIPYPIGLRLVIPAVTLLAFGAQFILSSFFLSLLVLKRAR